MRTRNMASTPSKQAATPSKGGPVVLPLEDIKVCIADAFTQLFADKKIVGSLVTKMAGTASQAKATSAVVAAINSNSKEFIAAAKNAGKEACAKHLAAPLADLAKTQTRNGIEVGCIVLGSISWSCLVQSTHTKNKLQALAYA